MIDNLNSPSIYFVHPCSGGAGTKKYLLRRSISAQVEGGVSSDRVLAVEMRVSEAAYGWSWGNVSASGCTLSFPAPSLRVTMDGATSFTAVVTISERGGDAVLAVPEGAFTDAAGRPNKAAKLSVRHSPTWAENISTASTTVTATSVGAAAASSVVASAAASASVVSGGVGAAGGAGVVSGMGVGAGGGGGGFVGAGSNVAGPGQLSGVVQAHILSMVAHVQFVSVLSSLRGSLPEGFRTFGTGLEWTNLDFEGLPWDVETAPGTADTSEAGSATRRLAWKGEGVAGARAGTCPGMRGFDAQSGMEMWLLRGSRTRGLTETNTGDQSEDIAAEDSVVLQALNSLTEESVTDDEAWASYYTRLLVGALAVGGAAILRRGFVSVWGWWRRRKGEDEETIEAKMPAMALFPKAELMAFAATMTGVCNGSGGIIGTGQAVGIAVGSLTVVLWATPFVWFVTHVVILRWIIREKRAEFVVEEDELGNQKDGLSVAHIPGEWREADPKARFLERYGHLFSQHAGNSGAESKWVEARREARRRKRESRQAERKAKEAKSIRVKIRPEDALPDTEDPNAEFMGPSAASGRRGRVQVVSTARHWRGGVDREKPEGEEEEEVELRGAGWLRRWMLVMLVPFNVRKIICF